MTLEFPIDIGNQCTSCGESTAPGSGRYINRVPSGTEFFTGWMCGECMAPDPEDVCRCPYHECEEAYDQEGSEFDGLCYTCRGDQQDDTDAFIIGGCAWVHENQKEDCDCGECRSLSYKEGGDI